MLFLKPGVRITGMRPEILLAALAAMEAYRAAGHDLMVTACVDGKHMTGSLHYAGAAIDLRTRDVAPADVQKLITQIKTCLGDDFDVLLEVDHLHIEFQPKQALTNV
jgi:hypothetical protein